MRQLIVQVPRGYGDRVEKMASEAEAINTTVLQGERDGTPVDLVVTNVSNRRVQNVLERVEELPEVHASFFPSGVLALRPPPTEAADQVTDVQPLSPIEVFLAGHQSVGSWQGFLSYAAASGAVVWVGLYIGSMYLLTAAMLVAPFAGPAMNAAIATTSGEPQLLRRSLVRYVAALGTTILVTGILTLLVGPNAPSPQMIEESQVASVALLLPLVAGAAGALYLQTSERNSLVSGAAVGLLVAASLAPPAGIVGMAAAMGRWDMVGNATFVLVLQLVGIHLSGAVVFRFFGLSHRGPRRDPGLKRLFPAGLAAAAIVLGVLLVLQFSDPVRLSRASLVQDVATVIDDEVSESALRPEHVRAQFMQSKGDRAPVLLAEIFIREPDDRTVVLDSAAQVIAGRVRDRIQGEWPEIVPVFDVRWVTGP